MIDFSRHEGFLDQLMLQASHLVLIGVGGAANLARQFAQSGIGELTIIDPDTVDRTNPVRQGYGHHQIGRRKVEALREDIAAINPETKVTALCARYEDINEKDLDRVWGADFVLALTDSAPTQSQINKDAISRRRDALFVGGYPGATAVEITGTFMEAVRAGRGCHRCQVLGRYTAIESGAPLRGGIPGHIFQGELANAMLGMMTLSYLHRQNSETNFGEPEIIERFMDEPFLTVRISPTYETGPGQSYAGLPPDFSLFTAIQWPPAAPDTAECDHCGEIPKVPTGSFGPNEKENGDVS